MSSSMERAPWHLIPWCICVRDTTLSVLLRKKQPIVLGLQEVIWIKSFSKDCGSGKKIKVAYMNIITKYVSQYLGFRFKRKQKIGDDI